MNLQYLFRLFSDLKLWAVISSWNKKNSASIVCLILMVSIYFYQKDQVLERYNLVKITGMDNIFQKEEWWIPGEGEKISYNVSCEKEHDRFRFTLPLKGHDTTTAELSYGLEGEHEYKFPLKKLPYLAEYTFVLKSKEKNKDFILHFQIKNMDSCSLSKNKFLHGRMTLGHFVSEMRPRAKELPQGRCLCHSCIPFIYPNCMKGTSPYSLFRPEPRQGGAGKDESNADVN